MCGPDSIVYVPRVHARAHKYITYEEVSRKVYHNTIRLLLNKIESLSYRPCLMHPEPTEPPTVCPPRTAQRNLQSEAWKIIMCVHATGTRNQGIEKGQLFPALRFSQKIYPMGNGVRSEFSRPLRNFWSVLFCRELACVCG
jgi:hypothetical protein